MRHYPGPRWWAASRLPWIRSTIKGTIVHDLLALHKQYGPVVRVAPNELSYITPDATKTIYQSNPEFPKDPMHLPAFHNGTPGILAADKRNHSRYRRLLASGFSDKGMRAQQPMIQYYIKLLLQRLRERSGSGSQDISEGYNWITFDIIGDLAFGESFDCLQNGKTHDWIASIQGNVKAIPIINAIRRFKLDWVIPLIAPKKLLEMRRRNAKFTEDKVDRRLRFGATRGDLWDDVIERSDKEGDSGMSRQEMISNASAIVLAGSETSATLLSGCTWFLLKNPHQLRQLESHVRSSFASETEIDLISVGKLDYMLAVLDEVLRLYPPVPVQSNRIVTKGGAMIAGQWVPEGVSPMALSASAASKNMLLTEPRRLWQYSTTPRAGRAPTFTVPTSSSPSGGWGTASLPTIVARPRNLSVSAPVTALADSLRIRKCASFSPRSYGTLTCGWTNPRWENVTGWPSRACGYCGIGGPFGFTSGPGRKMNGRDVVVPTE